jgi:hypothetical protein
MLKSMARHKKMHGARKHKAIPVAPLLPLVGVVFNDMKGGVNAGSFGTLTEDLTGFNMSTGKFSMAQAIPFWGATIAGVVVSKAASRVGLNAHVSKLTMGYFKL